MHVIYVAGPYRTYAANGQPDMFKVQQNIMEAMALSLEVWKRGAVAICPHSNTMFFTNADGCADNVWLEGDLELIRRCDALLVTPRWRESSGARAEVTLARERHIPVLEDIDDLNYWLRSVD